MREPTYRVLVPESRQLRVSYLVVGGTYHIGIESLTTHTAAEQQALAERIARLLTQDDEAKAREEHNARCIHAEHHETGGDEEWFLWALALKQGRPLTDLDRLEAAYRAAVEQT